MVRVVAQSKIGTNFINSRRPFTQGHSELLPDPRLEYDTRRVCTAVYGVAKPKNKGTQQSRKVVFYQHFTFERDG